jgi:hypothetical protein
MKKPTRYVRVDMGYGPAEHWEQAKVCDERTVAHLFDDGTSQELLVQLNSQERIWVSSWEEIQPDQAL